MMLAAVAALLRLLQLGSGGALGGGGIVLTPPHRVSTHTPIDVWAALPASAGSSCTAGGGGCELHIKLSGGHAPTEARSFPVVAPAGTPPFARLRVASLNVSAWRGLLTIAASIVAAGPWPPTRLASRNFSYEVVSTGVRSTRLVDGAFVDIVHWSAAEGLPYNEGLREMTSEQWAGQIADMAAAGIRTVTLQAIFINDAYSKDHPTCAGYPGVAMYPSSVFPRSGANASRAGNGVINASAATNFVDARDKIEAILRAADAEGVSVYIGLGSFAWFVFDDEALCWTKKVAAEVWSMYGHHRSLYGWYIAGEMAGDFSGGGPNVSATVDEMADFFAEFRRFAAQDLPPLLRSPPAAGAHELGPGTVAGGESGGGVSGDSAVPSLLSIMFAINSGGVMPVASQPSGGWHRVLQHIDVLAAFGFARIPNSATAAQMQQLCAGANTSFWVDMELFRADMSHGLLPKDFAGVAQELLAYDDAPQIGCAYEYTGQMAGPSPAPVGMASSAAKSLYSQYKLYYESVLSGNHIWPAPPPPPLPPQPLPPCLKADPNGTVSFILLSSDPSLCAPAPGKTVSHVRFVLSPPSLAPSIAPTASTRMVDVFGCPCRHRSLIDRSLCLPGGLCCAADL
eukprot:SAG22_NODE_591_length_8819_cov_3.667737_1_plen_625_part_00